MRAKMISGAGDVADLVRDRDTARAAFEAANSRADEAVRERDELAARLEKTTDELARVAERLTETRATRDSYMTGAAALRDERDAVKAELRKAREHIDELKARLHTEELNATRAYGQLDRVHQSDQLRLTAMGVEVKGEPGRGGGGGGAMQTVTISARPSRHMGFDASARDWTTF